MPKYGSQVIFGRIKHVAESMRHLQELWNDLSQICRYRGSHRGTIKVCKYRYHSQDTYHACSWKDCPVDEDTTDDNSKLR